MDDLTAETGIAAGHAVFRHPVGKLTEIALAKDHGSCLPQLFHQKTVLFGNQISQYVRPGSIRHAGDLDIVLQQDRNPIQKPIRAFFIFIIIQCFCLFVPVRTDGGHCIELFPLFIIGLYFLNTLPAQINAAQLALSDQSGFFQYVHPSSLRFLNYKLMYLFILSACSDSFPVFLFVLYNKGE